MKNITLILFVFISFNSFAQKPADNFLLVDQKYSAEDSIVTDAKNNTIHLYGKASFEHDGIHFKADEVIIYTDTKKVVGMGSIFLVSVPMLKSSTGSTNKKLLYTMGERFVVVE
ncbi:hypothetical protein [Daejeonella sp.]|uniref:hypothetical protein n=1 Tax=Daejeonella sp. TaxID=2805397 RepID=UPI0030BD195D